MNILDCKDILWLVLSYCDFGEQDLFCHYLRTTDAQICYKLLRHGTRIHVRVEDITTMLKSNMFDCVKLFLKQHPLFDFDLSSCYASLNYTIDDLLQAIATTPNMKWFIDLVVSPTMQQLIQITLKQFSLVENLNKHHLVLNLFFAQAPFEIVMHKISKISNGSWWYAMVGCLKRKEESEIKASIEFVEAETMFLNDKDLFKTILMILLYDPLPHYNVVRWLIQDRKISPCWDIEKVALYGKKDLFCNAEQLCSDEILFEKQESIFLNAIRSNNWDFVRYLGQKYGAQIIEKTLWYPVSCGFLEWLQICWDEKLANFDVIRNHQTCSKQTVDFLQRLMPEFCNRHHVQECSVNKKRKALNQ